MSKRYEGRILYPLQISTPCTWKPNLVSNFWMRVTMLSIFSGDACKAFLAGSKRSNLSERESWFICIFIFSWVHTQQPWSYDMGPLDAVHHQVEMELIQWQNVLHPCGQTLQNKGTCTSHCDCDGHKSIVFPYLSSPCVCSIFHWLLGFLDGCIQMTAAASVENNAPVYRPTSVMYDQQDLMLQVLESLDPLQTHNHEIFQVRAQQQVPKCCHDVGLYSQSATMWYTPCRCFGVPSSRHLLQRWMLFVFQTMSSKIAFRGSW